MPRKPIQVDAKINCDFVKDCHVLGEKVGKNGGIALLMWRHANRPRVRAEMLKKLNAK